MNFSLTSVAPRVLTEALSHGSSLLDKVALNPQPLPPKALGSLFDAVAINPQPLPPCPWDDLAKAALAFR
jgi:hypothetical protein